MSKSRDRNSISRKSSASDQDRANSRPAKPSLGNSGYAGYEYQIEVTIWIALDLILAKARTDALNVEPQSHEDIEASVDDPDNAFLDLVAQSPDPTELIFQVKTRSTAPWSSVDLASVLTGKADERHSTNRRRQSPLEMLAADPQRRYIFITNEALSRSLRVHQGQTFFDFPDVTELPPHARKGYDSAAQAKLAPRLLLCSGVTDELLQSRIQLLLTRHGHIPSVNQLACLRDLREEVRRRIRGEEDSRWTRDELVTMLARHGGSVAPTREMDHYVHPRSFNHIQKKLDQSHAVVIAGPSGTGKSLTGDILEARLREAVPPFTVVGEEMGPGHVRHWMTRPGATLFHLRDPWGGNRLAPGAERWSGELPKLLRNAGPERKFIITSRSDILRSAGHELTRNLEPYTVSIEIEDYGRGRLEEVYDGISCDLVGPARSLAWDYRETALDALHRPYEIDRFLVALTKEDPRNPRQAKDIISDSQIDAISGVIATQIEAMGNWAETSAAIIWALLVAREAVLRDVFGKLLRHMRRLDSSIRPEVEGLIDFMIAGRNLRRDGPSVALYHPKVEEGLRMAFMRRAMEAEHVLSLVIDGLVAMDDSNDDWGVETGLSVCRAAAKLDGIQLSLRSPTQVRLDNHLQDNALNAGRRFDFERAMMDLVHFGSKEHLPSRLARSLIDGAPETDEVTFGKRWRCPVLPETEIEELRKDARTAPLIDRFVRELLPFSRTDYGPAVANLLLLFSPSIGASFWDALDTVAGPGGPNENIEAIVAGACAGDLPDFDRAIARFARSEAEANVWFEETFAEDFRQAEEHEVDAVAADHILEEPQERYYNARSGMKAILELRGQREGLGWIVEHPHKQLLVAAAADLMGERSRVPSSGELRLLLENAEGWTRESVWRVIRRYWSPDLLDLLKTELTKEKLNSGVRGTLVAIAASFDGHGGGPAPLLAEVARKVPLGRQLELVYDLCRKPLFEDGRGNAGAVARRARAELLCETFDAPGKELGRILVKLLSGEKIVSVTHEISEPAVSRLASLVLDVSYDVAGPLVCAAAAVGADVIAAAKRLLRDGDADDGTAAVQALQMDGGDVARVALREALEHERYRVRRAALRALLVATDAQDRNRILALANDRSADVRLAWANLMQQHAWPEAIFPLVRLLGDQRDFSNDLGYLRGPSWSDFRVARAAARALGAYEELPQNAITALIETAQGESRDPLIACAAISALANCEDGRICDVIETALKSPSMKGATEYRPLAQAAAWSLFDRAVANKAVRLSAKAIRMAVEDDPVVAGPLLMTAGLVGGDTRGGLADRLARCKLSSRAELLRVSTVIAEPERGMTLGECNPILAKLASGTDWDKLSDEENNEVQAWAGGLDVMHEVDDLTVWVLKLELGIPLKQEVSNPRALRLPQRIGVLTMRSMSPAREEDESQDDGFYV